MKYRLLLAACLISLNVFSQERTFSGRVIDKESKEGVPFCVVKVKDRNEGVYTDENGRFAFTANADSAKTFIFYCMGYTKLELPAGELGRDSIKVMMHKEYSSLKEVVISDRDGKKKPAWMGKKKSKHASDCYQVYGDEVAAYIPAAKAKGGQLNEVFVYITDEGVPDSKFRIHVYEKDSVTNMPSNELTDSNLIVHATKGNEWVNVDLSNKHIRFSDGVFIGVEWLSGYGNKDTSLQSAKHAEVNKLNGQVLGLTRNSFKGKGSIRYVYHKNAFNSEWGKFSHSFNLIYAPMIYGKYTYYKN